MVDELKHSPNARRPEIVPTLENPGLHRIKSQLPDRPADPSRYESKRDTKSLEEVNEDVAHVRGERGATERIIMRNNAGEAEVAEILRRSPHVVARGSGSSLTGGAVPWEPSTQDLRSGVPLDESIVLDLSEQRNLEIGEGFAKVQPGVLVSQLQEELSRKGLYYPPYPTFEGATMGGIVANNAGGATNFKYKQTRDWVLGIKTVLANGEILDIKRGQYIAHPPTNEYPAGFFELENAAGEITTIPVPTYSMPDVPKNSGPYFAKPGMDLIDLFVGSEGTLGVITKATMKVIPLPQISWIMVNCPNDEQALELTRKLRDVSQETWKTPGSEKIDVSAIEYIDKQSMDLIKSKGRISPQILNQLPANPGSVLIIQMENVSDSAMNDFSRMLQETGSTADIFATPEMSSDISQDIRRMREAVPSEVNKLVGKSKKRDPSVSKMAGDMDVKFENLGDMLKFYKEEFGNLGLKLFIWGHFSDGNVHPNVIANSADDMKRAKAVMMKCAEKVVNQYHGTPIAEHGVGKIKQDLLRVGLTEDDIDQMRGIRRAFDPKRKFPDNKFAMSEGE